MKRAKIFNPPNFIDPHQLYCMVQLMKSVLAKRAVISSKLLMQLLFSLLNSHQLSFKLSLLNSHANSHANSRFLTLINSHANSRFSTLINSHSNSRFSTLINSHANSRNKQFNRPNLPYTWCRNQTD